VLTNTFESCALAPACWAAGHALLSLPVRSRGQPADRYLAALRGIVLDGEAALLVTEAKLAATLADADLGAPVVALEDLGRDGDPDPTPLAGEEIAFVQYSSGSTSEPKGCALSLRAIDAQLDQLDGGLGLGSGAQVAGWLPLSHDMGFFALMLPAFANGARTAIGPPERFVRSPGTWFEDMARFEATVSASPNFGFSLLARVAGVQPPAARLGPVRVFNGGERVQWTTITAVEEALGAHGLHRGTIAPAYGMAEATLCVTRTAPGKDAHPLWVDPSALAAGEVRTLRPGDEGALPLVSCGTPPEGTDVQIEGGADVGRIVVRTPSRATGYLGRPEETAVTFPDDRLVTNDLGTIQDGELYVIGRTDDVIVHGGRNVNARDAEELANAVPGVRPGTAVLVDVPGPDTTRLTMLAESTAEPDGLREVARALGAATFQAVGARLERCLFLASGTVPKTPSGKVQRHRARQLAHEPGAALIAEVVLWHDPG
jgi:acyl-CoA synthetase (AMP-forming)/AMP-acid ligase II